MTHDWSPSTVQQSRRSFVRVTAATLAGVGTASLAGCTTETAPEAETTAWSVDDRLDAIPDRATTVSYFHMQTVLDDEGIETLADGIYATGSSGPNTFAGKKAEFNETAPVSLDGLDEAVAFGRMVPAGSQYFGYLLVSDWDESAVVDTVEEFDGRTLSRETHADSPLYVPDVEEDPIITPTSLGVVKEGVYAVGHEAAVRDTLDVAGGNTDAVGQQLRDSMSSVRPGPVQFAIDIPEGAFEDASKRSEEPLSIAMFQDVTSVYGSLYRDENRRGLAVTFDIVDTDTARDIEEGFDGLLGLAEDEEGPPATVAANTETLRDGSTVTLVYEATLHELERLAEEIESQTHDSSETETERPAPPLRIEGATGTVTPDGIGGIELKLQLHGETERIEFTETRGFFAHPQAETEYPLVHESTYDEVADDDPEHGQFVTEPTDVLEDVNGQVTLRLNVGADTAGYDVAPFGEELPAGTEAFCFLETPDGPVRGVLRVPEDIDAETVDLTVEQHGLDEE